MKFIIPVLVFAVTCCSCSQSALTKQLSGSDSLVITFNVSNSDSIIKTVSTTEVKAIRKVKQFLDGKEMGSFKCGFDGNLIFYKDGIELLPVVFNYKEKDCRHFLLEVEGKLLSPRLNNEAADFLQSLEEGKTWY